MEILLEYAFELLPNATARYLAAGGFPEHARSEMFEEVRRRLRSDVVDRAIMRDLALPGGVDVVQALAFFIYLAQSSGSIFDAAARAREVGADPRSVRNWCRLFEDARLIASALLDRVRAPLQAAVAAVAAVGREVEGTAARSERKAGRTCFQYSTRTYLKLISVRR